LPVRIANGAIELVRGVSAGRGKAGRPCFGLAGSLGTVAEAVGLADSNTEDRAFVLGIGVRPDRLADAIGAEALDTRLASFADSIARFVATDAIDAEA
jgi:hypothetical protein